MMPTTVGYPADSITQAHADAAQDLWDVFLGGREYRKARERIWRRSERQYQGKTLTRPDDPTSDIINVNMSFSTANTILPHITGSEPEFIVAPFSHDATPKNARIQEAFLNRKWRHKPLGAQLALREAGHDYIIYGDGYLKTTYEIISRPRPGTVDQTNSIVEEHVDRVSPWDVWIDPNSTGIHNARWVAVRLWTTEDEARQVESYRIPSGYEFTTLDPTTDDDDRQVLSHVGSITDSRKWVVLYELYDVTNKMLYVVPESGMRKPWKVVEGITLPIEQLGNYRIQNSPYHMGDLEQIYDIQVELDKTRSQQMIHRKRNVAKVLIKEDSVSPEAEQALSSSVVGEFVPIKGEAPLGDLVAPVNLAPLPSESYAMSNQAQQDVYEITGISEYQRGTAPDITRTATEAQIMQGSSNVKLDAKLATIEAAVRNVGEYLLAIAREVYPETDVDEMAMFIGGLDGQAINQLEAGEQITSALEQGNTAEAESIARTSSLYGDAIVRPDESVFVGTYEVLVQHSSTDAVNPRVKAEKYRAMISQLGDLMPVLQQSGVQVNLAKLVRLWLEAEGIPGVEELLAAPAQDMGMGMGMGQAPPGAAMPGQPGPAPNDLAALLGAAQAGTPSGPIGPDNSGSLDPGSYPIVGA